MFIKRKRHYICILTNKSTLARHFIRMFVDHLDDIDHPVNQIKFSSIIDKYASCRIILEKVIKEINQHNKENTDNLKQLIEQKCHRKSATLFT